VNVNCISPGSVATETRSAPMSFFGIAKPCEMANAAVFLASSDSDLITGQNLAVDSGRTLSLKCD
jgi:NAD(P)-dependent dehydrogenase (short-subunit alcohol dehydrogenase family)